MRVVFVQSVSENFAVEIFSSLLKQKGHQCFLVYDRRLFDSGEISNRLLFDIFDIRENLINKIRSLQPDLIVFSVLTDQYQWALEMARRIKKKIKTPIIFGGVHVTMVPEEVISNDCVDIICVGEGENALMELVDSMQHARIDYSIDNLWFKKEDKIIKNKVRPLVNNLDSLPFPDKKLFVSNEPSLGRHYAIISGRGCPFSCTYCVSSAIKKISGVNEQYVRRRSPENVIDELYYARHTLKFNLKSVHFIDDTFTYNYDWLKEFCSMYKKDIHVPFHCTGYPSTVDYKKAALLKDAGCYRIGMGIQSVSEKTRKNILNRPGTNEQIKRAVQACREAGLSFWLDHILNLPSETEEEQLAALKFYNELRPPTINVFWLIYYPKTRIVDIAKDAGILDDATIAKINQGKTSTSMVVGVGGKYSFAKENILANFAFLLHLLPLLPKSWMDKIIARKMFMGPRFRAPVWLNFLIKSLVRVKIGQAFDSLWTVGMLFKGMYNNFMIKLFGYNIKTASSG
ncbi:MAG: radical SAM protein [Candidatus Omnitrophica bacterium]|nr:radical SAM protein [Candidatus Omnitrophota bacterium]